MTCCVIKTEWNHLLIDDVQDAVDDDDDDLIAGSLCSGCLKYYVRFLQSR